MSSRRYHGLQSGTLDSAIMASEQILNSPCFFMTTLQFHAGRMAAPLGSRDQKNPISGLQGGLSTVNLYDARLPDTGEKFCCWATNINNEGPLVTL